MSSHVTYTAIFMREAEVKLVMTEDAKFKGNWLIIPDR